VAERIGSRWRFHAAEVDTASGSALSGHLASAHPAGRFLVWVRARQCRWRLTAVADGQARMRYSNTYFGFSLEFDAATTDLWFAPVASEDLFPWILSGVSGTVDARLGSVQDPPSLAEAAAIHCGITAVRLERAATDHDVDDALSRFAGPGLVGVKRPSPVTIGGATGKFLQFKGRLRPIVGDNTAVPIRISLWVLRSGSQVYVIEAGAPLSLWGAAWTGMAAVIDTFRVE
jgi:hypothetical protein